MRHHLSPSRTMAASNRNQVPCCVVHAGRQKKLSSYIIRILVPDLISARPGTYEYQTDTRDVGRGLAEPHSIHANPGTNQYRAPHPSLAPNPRAPGFSPVHDRNQHLQVIEKGPVLLASARGIITASKRSGASGQLPDPESEVFSFFFSLPRQQDVLVTKTTRSSSEVKSESFMGKLKRVVILTLYTAGARRWHFGRPGGKFRLLFPSSQPWSAVILAVTVAALFFFHPDRSEP